MIQVSGIKLNIGESKDRLPAKVESRLRVPKGTIQSVRIVKESLDAREKPRLFWVYTLELESEKTDEWLAEACRRTNTQWAPVKRVKKEIRPLAGLRKGPAGTEGDSVQPLRPVVAGFGPCGMFAALALAEYGLKPVVLERGGSMEERVRAVEAFWNGGRLDPECNVQFGEGGAGTFSDGKLTTGTKSPWAEWILQSFVNAGASPEILYKQKPHIGTDVLRTVVVNIRKRIEELGGRVLFGCRLDSLDIAEENGPALRGIKYTCRDGSTGFIPADCAVLALGHSARDTVRALFGQGLVMEQKPFSMGVRIEHPQSLIDKAQLGGLHEDLGIGPADYKLNVKTSTGRGVYTFCMCPGGYVINSSSAPGMLVTNGMSNSDRGSETANAALLADVLPEDYAPQYLPEGTDPKSPLAGMALQEKYESLAFALGGGNYCAPVQTVGSFLGGSSQNCGELPLKNAASPAGSAPTFRPGTAAADLRKCLPEFVSDALREALPALGKKLKGFDSPDAVMTGIESRSSSPVRIKRDPESLQAIGILGLYPAGEGAGYAGGIMSAAADGVRIAEKIASLAEEKLSREKPAVRLIALDLDGTVLTDEKTVTPRTAKAIATAAERGITVVPVTGRPMSGLPEDLLKICGIKYVISSNGALTEDISSAAVSGFSGKPGACAGVTGGRTVRSEFLSRDTVEKIVELCVSHGATFNIFIDGLGYCLPQSYHDLITRFTGKPLDDYVKKSRRMTEDLDALLESSGSRVENIWIKAKDQAERDRLSSQIKALGARTVLTAATDVEVGSPQADKGLALNALAKALGIPRSQILAIGDNDNDLGMLREAGTAVAMGNATAAVKAMASYTTASNQDDGVAIVIESLI